MIQTDINLGVQCRHRDANVLITSATLGRGLALGACKIKPSLQGFRVLVCLEAHTLPHFWVPSFMARICYIEKVDTPKRSGVRASRLSSSKMVAKRVSVSISGESIGVFGQACRSMCHHIAPN